MFICFAEAKRQYATSLNRLAAFVTGGKFCHVAVVFEIPGSDGRVQYIECSIQRSENENINKVHLSHVENFEGWTCYRLQMERPEYEIEAYNYVCRNLLGTPYDVTGSILDFTLCCCLPWGYTDHEETGKTYCSRLALHILHKVGQFLDHSPEKISPNGLYKLIMKSKDTHAKWTDVSPYANAIFSKQYTAIPVHYAHSSSGGGLLYF